MSRTVAVQVVRWAVSLPDKQLALAALAVRGMQLAGIFTWNDWPTARLESTGFQSWHVERKSKGVRDGVICKMFQMKPTFIL